MTDAHESKNAVPWKVSDAPADYIEKMVSAIVGIEIPITRLAGKWKVSQSRTEPDRVGVIAGLESDNTQNTKALSRIIQKIGSYKKQGLLSQFFLAPGFSE